MPEHMYRTQLLLEQQQQRELADIAGREGRSISDVVREMIRVQLDQRKRTGDANVARQLGALERIRQRHAEFLARHNGKPLAFDVVEMIQQTREEQDERNFSAVIDPRH